MHIYAVICRNTHFRAHVQYTRNLTFVQANLHLYIDTYAHNAEYIHTYCMLMHMHVYI